MNPFSVSRRCRFIKGTSPSPDIIYRHFSEPTCGKKSTEMKQNASTSIIIYLYCRKIESIRISLQKLSNWPHCSPLAGAKMAICVCHITSQRLRIFFSILTVLPAFRKKLKVPKQGLLKASSTIDSVISDCFLSRRTEGRIQREYFKYITFTAVPLR